MNPNWLGVASGAFALIAFFVVYRLGKTIALKKRMLFALVATTAALPGASFAVYYAHIFPEPSWYYQFRSITGTELLIAILGVAGGLVATFLPRAVLILPFFCVSAFSTVPFLKPFIRPIPAGSMKDKWDDEVCLQSTGSTCGPASTATILKGFGMEVSESELAAEAHSYEGGTEAWYLGRAARVRGFDVEFVETSELPRSEDLPAIAGVRLGLIGHFIPIIDREGEVIIIGDPLRGKESLSLDEFNERYDFTGFQIRIRNRIETSG